MIQASLPSRSFWKNRRVLVTGHTGFKGAWLTCWLYQLGADVMGVSLPEPVSTPSLWDQLQIDHVFDVRGDLTLDGRWTSAVRDFSPHIVIHLAAQPLVSVGWAKPAATYTVNIQGTVQLLALTDRLPGLVATVIVTTDKVYDPEHPPPHRETSQLGGNDPYSASKAAVELVVRAWPTGTPRGTARAGNVIGGGDWACDRLVPDLVRAWGAGRVPVLRNPNGIRPWQHVLEPLRGYLLYAEALATDPAAPRSVNLGPSDAQSVAVRAVVEFAAEDWRARGHALPEPCWTHLDVPAFPETAVLRLESALAREVLGWEGILDWKEALHYTLEWYDDMGSGVPAVDLVDRQLAIYTASLKAAR